MIQKGRTTNIAAPKQQALTRKTCETGASSATVAMTSAEDAPDMSEEVTDGDMRTEEITSRNGRESPLLRLPAELREMIWEYAFGRQTVHPRGNSMRPWIYFGGFKDWGSKDWRITHFDLCREPFSDRELYSFHQQAALQQLPEVVYPQSVPVDETGLHLHCSEHTDATVRRQLVPPVCKQISHEAVPSAWRTTVFAFKSPSDLVSFYMSSDTPLGLVNHITLILDNCTHGQRTWDFCLRELPVASFTALRGLNLVLPRADLRIPHSYLEDWLYHPPIQQIIFRCKDIPLQEDQTTVLLLNPPLSLMSPQFWWWEVPLAFPKRVALAEVIRAHILHKRDVTEALQLN